MTGRDAVVRDRVATSTVFVLYGTILGVWTARIPTVRSDLGLSDGQLGVALLAFAVGAIAGMQLSGRLTDRFGSIRIMVVAVFLDAAMLVLPAHAGGLAGLTAVLLCFGAAHGVLNVAMNVHAVEVERAWGRPVISSFHAVYSIGGFAGAAAGGLFATAGAGAAATFAWVAGGVAVLAAAATVTGRWTMSPSPAGSVTGRSGPAPATRTERMPPGMTLLAALVFCCLVGEGAAADWSAVYLRDELGSDEGIAASAYAVFSVAMTAGRLVGDRLAAAVGPVRLVRWSGVVAAVGLGGALFVPHPVAGAAGFACLGLGLSCIAPQVFSAAGRRDPARAGRALARIAGIGFLGFVVGPVVIGAVAELVGLTAALAIPAVLALAVALSAGALRPAPRATADAVR